MKQENDQLRRMLVLMNGALDAPRGTPVTQKNQEPEFKTPDEGELREVRRLGAAEERGAKDSGGTPDTAAVMLKSMEGMQALQEKVDLIVDLTIWRP